jgi:hypothetical protein
MAPHTAAAKYESAGAGSTGYDSVCQNDWLLRA